MKQKTLSIALIFCIAICVGGYFYFVPGVATQSRTFVMAELQKTKEIDKLYTGTYLVPAMDLNRGLLKRDVVTHVIGSPQEIEDKKVILGYCIKPIEVSFGYDALTKILSDESVIQNVCSGNIDKLPAPVILAANPQHDIIQGKYDSTGACYSWGHRESRNAKILAQMQEDGILEKAQKRGRQSLKNFLAILCK